MTLTPNPTPAESEARITKAFCELCGSRQTAILDACRDVKTDEPFTDLVCSVCHSIIATMDGHVALASPAPEVASQGLPAPVGVSDERIEALTTRIAAYGLASWFHDFDADDSGGKKTFAGIEADIRALLAEAVLPPEGQDKAVAPSFGAWQPIETAPKDGTPILGCTWIPKLQHLYSPRAIFWAAYHPNATGSLCWRDAPTCGNKVLRLTHWRPMLAPPEVTEQPQGRDSLIPNAPQGQAAPSTRSEE